MEEVKQIDTNLLRSWLEEGKEVSIPGIRPIQEKTEWYIPQSIYFNVYDKLKAKDEYTLHRSFSNF